MNAEVMKDRTRTFALRAIRLAEALPKTRTSDVIAKQLLRAATSTAANYRAACLSRSRAEFLAKLGVVQEEADESLFWIELAVDAELIGKTRVQELLREAREILSIIVASRKTLKKAAAPDR